MDCDDALLLLAKPAHDQQPQLEEHLSTCAACRELVDRDDDGTDSTEGESDPEPASGLIGRMVGAYQITKVIGAGGMGVVYLAIHPVIGSRVAIKVFSRDWSKHPRLVARFFAEARATSVIAHENIVNVLDVGRLDDGRPYLIMEHLLGQSLAAMIGTRALTDAVTQRLMVGVLGALAAAHKHDIVHRDLKPDNIFVSPALSTTLLDFGIAKLHPDLARGAIETVTGVVLGTPQYMSPEQARGDPVDERTDIYAIGVILYECFLGRRPFEGSSTYVLLERQVHRPPIRPRLIRPDLGADLEEVILTALAKRPEDRFGSASALQSALAACEVSTDRGAFSVAADAWQGHDVDSAKPSGIRTAASSPRARKPHAASSRPVVAVALAGVAGVAAVAALVTWRVSTDDAPARLVSKVPHTATPDHGSALVPETAVPDASILTDASPAVPTVVDAGVTVKPRPLVVKKPRGTEPLSLFADADALARAKMPDVVLVRIIVRSPTPDGLIERTSGGSVTFDFLSPSRVERYADRRAAPCVTRVVYGAASEPVVERLTTPCAKFHPLPPSPRCSLATVLRSARSLKKLPPGLTTMATLIMSAAAGHRRPLWKIVVDKTEYQVEYSVAQC